MYSTYLGLIALFAVKSNPLAVLGGVGDLLVIDPLDGCTLQEGTDLEEQRHVRPFSRPSLGVTFHFISPQTS